MTAISVLIVDDERPARKRLRRMLESVAGIEIVAEAENGREALALVDQHQPALVLMDIQMPGMDGLETAKSLAALETPPAVIFCTDYDEHALSAFDAAALDYLLKPIEKPRLEMALQRVERLLSPSSNPVKEPESLVLATGSSTEKIALESVLCFRAEQKYVVAVHRTGEGLLRESLQQLEQAWPTRFLRVHRNTLIARRYLRGITRDGNHYRAILEHLEVGPLISRRHLQDVKAALTQAD